MKATSIIINEIENEDVSNEGLKNYYDFKSPTEVVPSAGTDSHNDSSKRDSTSDN